MMFAFHDASCGVCYLPALFVLYKHGIKLVGDRTRLLKVQVTKSQFADDLALYTVT